MRLIIFADYGLDDAVATLHIFNHNRWDNIDIAAVGGNVDASKALQNAQKLLFHYEAEGGDTANIRIIDTTKVKQPYHALPSIHGNDGMGDILTEGFIKKPLDFKKWLKELGKTDCEILSLGTLTVPLILAKNGFNVPSVVMGGCVNTAPNFGDYEFNEALDVESFKQFINMANPVVAALDTARNKKLDFKDFKPYDNSLFCRMTKTLVDLTLKRHNDYAAIYDYAAARILTHSHEFKIENVTDPHGLSYKLAKVID